LTADETPSLLSTFLPSIIGGMLTLLGVLVTNFLTRSRESARAKFEWGKFLFEKYEEHYREFILGLEGTLDPKIIKNYYKRLNTKAFIPSYLKKSINDTLNVLESKVDINQKKIAHGDLLYDLDQFMQNPWNP
jgi:hypothetical protein